MLDDIFEGPMSSATRNEARILTLMIGTDESRRMQAERVIRNLMATGTHRTHAIRAAIIQLEAMQAGVEPEGASDELG